MKILHFYSPDKRGMIVDYVSLLCNGMQMSDQVEQTTDAHAACQLLGERKFDILHLHGCWDNASYYVVRQALKTGTRFVITPHGQLEPWVRETHYWKEKLPKQLLYQKRMVRHAYAMIVQGAMEEECMRKLGWNPRMVIVRNSLITNSITPLAMIRQVSLVYRQVMNSDTLHLMSENTKKLIKQLIKTGITGDKRWLTEEPCSSALDDEEWRRLLCFVHHEQIDDIVARGFRILHLDAPELNASQLVCFMPDNYESPQTIESVIGISFASENERLLATFRHLRRLILRHRLALSHLVELHRELRFHDAEEETLNEELRDRHLYSMAARLMQLAHDLTGMEEGFMPMPPLNDRMTRTIRKQIDNHLRI